jgi:hypothetical protein
VFVLLLPIVGGAVNLKLALLAISLFHLPTPPAKLSSITLVDVPTLVSMEPASVPPVPASQLGEAPVAIWSSVATEISMLLVIPASLFSMCAMFAMEQEQLA